LTVFIGISEFISGHYAVFTLSIVTFLFLIFICFSRPLFLSFEKNKVRIKNIIGSKEVNYKDIELVKIQRIKNRKGDNNHALVLILLDGTKVYLGSNFLKPSEDLKSILDKHMHAIKEKHSEVS
jgi:hypothetical protein